MPQMSPMYWLLLFLWMLMFNYMIISILYFVSYNILKVYSKNCLKKIKIKFN